MSVQNIQSGDTVELRYRMSVGYPEQVVETTVVRVDGDDIYLKNPTEFERFDEYRLSETGVLWVEFESGTVAREGYGAEITPV